jgi:cell division protein FtsQ
MSITRSRPRRTSGPTGDPDPDVDPRIADRRHEVARQHRSKRWRRLGAVTLVVALIMGALALSRSTVLDVDRVQVTGADRTGVDAVAVASSIELGEPMTDLDLGSAASSIGALPWVLDVDVRRSWPASVEITVTEREPAAVIEMEDGAWYLIGDHGRLLEQVDEPDPAYLQLVGVDDATGEAGEDLVTAEDQLAVVAAITDSVAERIFAVARVEDRLELWMAPAGLVLFGSATQLEEKFLAIDTVFTQVDDRCMAVLDVRIPQTPTLNRIPACANPEPEVPESAEASDATVVEGVTIPDDGMPG